MKYILFFCLGLSFLISNGQNTSESFTISGDVLKTEKIDLARLTTYTPVHLDSLRIFNHDMLPKGLMQDINGVLLKDILAGIPFNNENPKVLSEYYIECQATDGYKVIFSWNELFNSETGNHVMIITSKNGVNVTRLEDRIVLLSASDKATGRRFVKWLSKIIVHRQRN